MAKPGETGIKRIIHALGYAVQGLKGCWRNEAAFRQEVLGMLVAVPLAFWLGEGGMEVALLLFPCLLLLIVEVLNSGIEAVVDRIGPEHHLLSGLAKDLGAAAVLLSILTLALTWGLVLFF